MLVLTRRSGEGIVVGGTIEVAILSVDRNRVKLGISAPPRVSVHRKEVYLRIRDTLTRGATG